MIQILLAAVLASPPATYEGLYARALAERRPLVVFVGVPAMPYGEWISYQCPTFPGVPGKGVILSLPRDGYLEWVDTLDWWLDADTIWRRITETRTPPRKWNPYQSFVAPPRAAPVMSPRMAGASC